MARSAACWPATLALALAACGGSSGEPAPAPARGDATGKVVTGEVRTPDARTPLVRGAGLWRCETAGSVELRVSTDGLATLALDGQLLASVVGDRALINRACTARRPAALPPFRAPRAVNGASHLRCSVPRRILVDLSGGDLTVRAPGRGRFLVGAAVNPDHLAVAGYWSAGCSLR